jgi:trans-aconitate methyltransferase
MSDRTTHWDGVYGRSAVTEVSWFQREPAFSLRLIAAAGLGPDDAVIDVGGGASVLVDRLLEAGNRDVTVLDIAAGALAMSRSRLGDRADQVHWVTGDLLDWRPDRRYGLWHDRAVFHFLTERADRDRYRSVLDGAVAAGGYAVVAAFAVDGPAHCSGLPTARYAPEDLAAEFPAFRTVSTAREEHHTPAGRVQPFSWVLLAS